MDSLPLAGAQTMVDRSLSQAIADELIPGNDTVLTSGQCRSDEIDLPHALPLGKWRS